MLEKLLVRFWGHDVRLAGDGVSGLEAAAAFRPELVICDIGLPGFDGYEVARRPRATPASRDSLLVALTGYGTEEDRRRAFEAGFDHHLVKPTSIDAVRRLLIDLPPPDHRASPRPAGNGPSQGSGKRGPESGGARDGG